MGLLEEEKVLSENQHEQGDIQGMEIGDSVGFYFDNTKTGNSSEYGEFTIAQGLKVDLTSNSTDDLINNATPFSFIPNTLLKNKIAEGGFLKGEIYRIEKAWNKGQEFKDGKKAKGYGFELFHLKAGTDLTDGLKKRYGAALGGGAAGLTETPVAAASAKPKPKLA